MLAQWKRREGDTAAYLVKIVNKPHQVAISKIWYTKLVPLTVKDVVELVVKA